MNLISFGNKVPKDKCVVEAKHGECEQQGEQNGSTDPVRPTVTDKVLRSSSQIAVVVSVMTLQEKGHFNGAQMMVCCGNILII